MACGPCDFVAGALALLARGSGPPEPAEHPSMAPWAWGART